MSGNFFGLDMPDWFKDKLLVVYGPSVEYDHVYFKNCVIDLLMRDYIERHAPCDHKKASHYKKERIIGGFKRYYMECQRCKQEIKP